MARARGLSLAGHQWPPIGAPHYHHHHHHHHPQHDPSSLTTPRDGGSGGSQFEYDSVNAVSFGFVATAVLISMFLVMAIFEKFLRPSPSPSPSPRDGARQRVDLEPRDHAGKLGHPSPKMTVYDDGVSVLMPGDDVPSYIAHPAPVPCPRENILWPSHRRNAPS
ncbi:uncharacterized protein LOC115690842 [Syzygium oleosum]|uniref:uncharacterized protein LOC115690842 n=1 Tax=Syzygium oleosum TaxID=219896 RepID=UPI0024BAF90A|nr:uncharacterized protein LOC115690842 [Syzygium oleosum]